MEGPVGQRCLSSVSVDNIATSMMVAAHGTSSDLNSNAILTKFEVVRRCDDSLKASRRAYACRACLAVLYEPRCDLTCI
jgi:hypothetical protein